VQVVERRRNIFSKIVSHLPFEFAILNLDRENHYEGALTKARLLLLQSFALAEPRSGRDVKKSAKKMKKLKPRPVEVEVVVPEAVDMEALRDQIRNQVCAAAAGMVRTTIEQVNDGHYQGMKNLFEMIGLYPATAVPDRPQEDSLAGMLLSRLGIGEETLAEGEQANHVK
jgi:hypothetical protein